MLLECLSDLAFVAVFALECFNNGGAFLVVAGPACANFFFVSGVFELGSVASVAFVAVATFVVAVSFIVVTGSAIGTVQGVVKGYGVFLAEVGHFGGGCGGVGANGGADSNCNDEHRRNCDGE
jgi:hypothetical protein